MKTTLTRRYSFSASHVLARSDWDEEQNREVYGKCANPAGHGHNYGLEVTVSGKVDAETGVLLRVESLDALVTERVLRALDRKLLNRDVADFSRAVPTAENIARFCWQRLVGAVSPAELDRVRLVETGNNSVEYAGE